MAACLGVLLVAAFYLRELKKAENAILKRVLIVVTCILAITIIGIFYAQKTQQDQDKRTEYIESGHSEIR